MENSAAIYVYKHSPLAVYAKYAADIEKHTGLYAPYATIKAVCNSCTCKLLVHDESNQLRAALASRAPAGKDEEGTLPLDFSDGSYVAVDFETIVHAVFFLRGSANWESEDIKRGIFPAIAESDITKDLGITLPPTADRRINLDRMRRLLHGTFVLSEKNRSPALDVVQVERGSAFATNVLLTRARGEFRELRHNKELAFETTEGRPRRVFFQVKLASVLVAAADTYEHVAQLYEDGRDDVI